MLCVGARVARIGGAGDGEGDREAGEARLGLRLVAGVEGVVGSCAVVAGELGVCAAAAGARAGERERGVGGM
jgi:hypothetical protein